MGRNIGAKVQHYRKRMGLTQKELAARLQVNGCDLSETIVGHIETGHRAVSVFEIDKLVEVLHVDYNALFAQD
jgi:transcriptional regulator with XRE-family HTH domain